MRILVVEDELDLQDAIKEGLRILGYAVDSTDKGLEAEELLFVEDYDLVILDLNLPDIDGLEILKTIILEKPNLKIIILSARSGIEDRVKGLDLGAMDYLIKPFDFEELEARIRTLLRRNFSQANNIINYGKIQVDLSKRTVMVDNEMLVLTKKEFSILEYLILNKDRIITQEELVTHIWDINADCFSSSVRVHITTLRKKLKEKIGYNLIENKIKEGYFLKEE